MKKYFIQKNKAGYTIIETMIAISLFLVVVVSGMGALLNANLIHNKSNDTREILDNLSFIMEDMSRNIRTGYNYHCVDNGNFSREAITDPHDCVGDGAIAFEQQNGNPNDAGDQWIYSIEGRDENGEIVYDIFKSTDGDTQSTRVQLNPKEVTLSSDSKFTVTGAPSLSDNDRQQPYVTIKLVGEIKYKNTITPFSLQTSVSQRKIDI